MKELDVSSVKSDAKKIKKLIADFRFTPAEESKNIRLPILTPPVEKDVPGSDPEPVYSSADQDDIQGNIIPGFNKDFQHFLFYKIGDVKNCKCFLEWIVPYLASMEEVLAFRRLFRSLKLRVGEPINLLASTWVNIAFSHRAIAILDSRESADKFGDQSFRQGLAARSSYLGDPTDPTQAGHPSKWLVGGPDNEADVIIIVAADSTSLLDETCSFINKKAAEGGMKLLFQQSGATLPDELRGHEHFGFKDGVSQPGIRGKLSTTPGDYITPRYFDDTDSRRLYMGKPGQLMAWPGQFLLGEQRQDPNHLYHPAPPLACFPAWATKGSYLVVRRLRQDVQAFWTFVSAASTLVGFTPEKVASMLIGRWPSGAPIIRTPDADNLALGEDSFANNHFIFDDNTRPSNLEPIPGYAGDSFPPGLADMLAKVCPHFAHIRKVNPRDSVTDLGKPEDNLTHMILRRGIPFGQHIVGVKNPSKELLQQERGLMFLSYGSSIEDQFEFLQRRWSNSAVQPNLGGNDPIIGQNGGTGDRRRFIDFPGAKGTQRIQFTTEWVTATGGGYFFAPTISVIRNVLAKM